MDPIQILLTFLRSVAPSPEAFSAMESRVQEIFHAFSLVPKHEYEAHMEIVKTLTAQVAHLETRLDALSGDTGSGDAGPSNAGPAATEPYH